VKLASAIKSLGILLVLITSFEFSFTQIDSPPKKKNMIFSIGAGAHYGFIISHSPEVEYSKGSHPFGIEANLSWQRNDSSVWNLCNCFPRKGLLLAFYNYDNEILGKSLSAAYFLEPTYRISDKTFFSFKAALGLSYMTDPFDSIKNPSNRSYSTKINQYLLLGIGFWFRIDQHWWLNGMLNYQHESNGGLKQPNKGINWPTASLAFSYQTNPSPYYKGIRRKEKFWKGLPIRWDLGVFGIAKRTLDENGESKRLPLIGLYFQGAKQVGSINNLTLSTEVFYDDALNMRLKIDSIQASAVRAGFMIGHEFILGKFLFSQRIGVYIFNQTNYFDSFFHRWGIHYNINNHLGFGFNLMAHRHVADFIDARLTWGWGRHY